MSARSESVKPVRYVGLDTETYEGRAILIGTPTDHARVASWGDIWSFLIRQTSRDFILFNLPYDVRAMVAYLPKTVMRALHLTGRATYRDWYIEQKTAKMALVSKGGDVVRMWDVYPYYESSLDQAAADHLGERKLEIPTWWYADMRRALQHDPDRVIEYMRRDAALTERLWTNFADKAQEMGVNPYRAASPASLATRAFPSAYRRAGSIAYTNPSFKPSYYGARIEIYRRGRIGRCYLYDLKSAYPSVLASLEDPTGTYLTGWRPTTTPGRYEVMYGAYKVAIDVPVTTLIPPVPVRTPTGLIFPAGCFWTTVDVETLRWLRRSPFKHRVVSGWELVRAGGTARPMFDGIRRWFEVRRERADLSLAIKKILNSCYGKLAEQIDVYAVERRRRLRAGHRYLASTRKWYRKVEVDSRHTAFAVAGAVTAGIRLKLLDAMMRRPSCIVAAATDGVISTAPLFERDELGDDLGDWTYEGRTAESYVFGTGVAAHRWPDGEWYERTRGFRMTRDQTLRACFESKRSTVQVETMTARSMAKAAQQGYTGLNRMDVIGKDIDVNMDRRRAWPRPFESWRQAASTDQRSLPLVTVERSAVRALYGGT